jgi:hypothetical protein
MMSFGADFVSDDIMAPWGVVFFRVGTLLLICVPVFMFPRGFLPFEFLPIAWF